MRSANGRNGRYKVRVISATVSVRKAQKIIMVAGRLTGGERDAYLRGVRDTIGGELGIMFSRGAESGEIRNVARFCRDGWRAMGGDAAATAFFSAKMDSREFLREMRRLCDRAIREGGAE